MPFFDCTDCGERAFELGLKTTIECEACGNGDLEILSPSNVGPIEFSNTISMIFDKIGDIAKFEDRDCVYCGNSGTYPRFHIHEISGYEFDVCSASCLTAKLLGEGTIPLYQGHGNTSADYIPVEWIGAKNPYIPDEYRAALKENLPDG